MISNYSFKNVNDALPSLLFALSSADEVGSRVGRTKEMMHVGITLREPWHREILLPARKPDLAAQIAETMWVLGGRDDMEFLLHYLPRAAEFSDDGKTWRAGYGARLRDWNVDAFVDEGISYGHIDQIKWVYEHLKKDPASRRAVLSIWDPTQDTVDGVKDIPCNDWLNFSSRNGYLDLHVAVRSNDIIWGWSGINQFEWSALLEVMAGLLGLRTGSLHFSTTSLHIYDRHWAKAEKIVDHASNSGADGWGLKDSPRFTLPEYLPQEDAMKTFDLYVAQWFEVEQMIRTGDLRYEEAVRDFPEPMLQSWLRVLQWWWTGEKEYLEPLEGTRLERATLYSVQPPEREFETLVGDNRPVRQIRVDLPMRVPGEGSPFIRSVIDLHNEKHEAYGDSWKKRGEMFSIIPNIARKVDRLGGSDTRDETSADTAQDLLVYLAKYRTWLQEQAGEETNTGAGTRSGTPEYANEVLLEVDAAIWPSLDEDAPTNYQHCLETDLKQDFERLADMVEQRQPNDGSLVDSMLVKAYRLAVFLGCPDEDEYRGADVD